MKDLNILMDEVIEQRLETAKNENEESEVRNKALKEAGELYKLRMEERKFEASLQQQEIEKQIATKNDKKRDVLKYVEIAAVPVATLLLDFALKRSFARMLCNFEKDYNFTTTAGKSLGQLLRFKK